MFMTDAAWKSDPKNKSRDKMDLGVKRALSLDYRKQAFRLALVGSDGVVFAYNSLMQSFFHAGDTPHDIEKAKSMMSLIGNLLLEIRKSMGNEDTELDRWAMIEWFISDAPKYRT